MRTNACRHNSAQGKVSFDELNVIKQRFMELDLDASGLVILICVMKHLSLFQIHEHQIHIHTSSTFIRILFPLSWRHGYKQAERLQRLLKDYNDY
jgi:hypothetical protein